VILSGVLVGTPGLLDSVEFQYGLLTDGQALIGDLV
jgi:hypothetical protein